MIHLFFISPGTSFNQSAFNGSTSLPRKEKVLEEKMIKSNMNIFDDDHIVYAITIVYLYMNT